MSIIELLGTCLRGEDFSFHLSNSAGFESPLLFASFSPPRCLLNIAPAYDIDSLFPICAQNFSHNSVYALNSMLFLLWFVINRWKVKCSSLLLFTRLVTSDSLWQRYLSTPGYPVLHYLLEFAQTHIHEVSGAIRPFCPLSLPYYWATQSGIGVGGGWMREVKCIYLLSGVQT